MTPLTNIREAEQQDAAVDRRRTRGEIRAAVEATVVVLVAALLAGWGMQLLGVNW